MKITMNKTGKMLAAALSPLFFAMPFALADEEKGAETTAEASKLPTQLSVSLEAAYAKSTKCADKGGVDMAGLDLRLNYAVDEENHFSVGMLMLSGSENMDENGRDLRSTDVALLCGYRFVLPVVPDKFSLFVGARAGIAFVDYVIDDGRFNGWDHYREDTDLCAAYAGEVGFSYSFNQHWSVRGGYEYYGNTSKTGGGNEKFSEQQYHVVQLGAEYRF